MLIPLFWQAPAEGVTALSPDWCHSDITLSGDNLIATHIGATNHRGFGSLDAKTTGKHYFEAEVLDLNATPGLTVGVGDYTAILLNGMGGNGNNVGLTDEDAIYIVNGGANTIVAGPDLVEGDIVSVAVDADTREVAFRVNGGVEYGPYTVPGANPIFPRFSLRWINTAMALNFGAAPFIYGPPPGYQAWLENAAYQGDVWRFQQWQTSSASGHAIAEVELRLTPAGADQTAGGAASASSTFGANVASLAIDDSAASFWGSADTTSWWQVDIGAEQAIRHILHTVRGDGFNQYPAAGAWTYSRDGGTTFFPARAWNGLAWVSGETKTFDIFQ